MDAGRAEEAVALLLELLNQAGREENVIYQIRAATVLGEYYYRIGDKELAGGYLIKAGSAD